MKKESFISKTEEILMPGSNQKCLCSDEFYCVETKSKQKCILYFGMNPSGDESSVIAEKNAVYLYYLPNISIKNRTFPRYYKPIFNTISKITNDNAKWGWCNYDSNYIESMISNDKQLTPYADSIKSFYSEYKEKEYSVYIGEFFYYHEKSQSKFLKYVNMTKINKYIIEMLEMHIDRIVNLDNTLSAIIINNTTASKLLCDAFNIDYNHSFYDYKYHDHTYRVFFGSMLSGLRAMDDFSKHRLIKDIKDFLSSNNSCE